MQNPTVKALSTLTANGVRYLLMGGQACVLYGAAQFSRDADITVLADRENLARLQAALAELQANVIAVPPFDRQYLDEGLAVHFRCLRPDLLKLRLDVMSSMRGVDSFEQLWQRRTTIQFNAQQQLELLGVADLVQAKKTQRDKDWPMIRALVDAHYESFRETASEEQILFWLREGRSPKTLIALAAQYETAARAAAQSRDLLYHAFAASERGLWAGLAEEQRLEQEADRIYWQPLQRQLEMLRRNRTRGS